MTPNLGYAQCSIVERRLVDEASNFAGVEVVDINFRSSSAIVQLAGGRIASNELAVPVKANHVSVVGACYVAPFRTWDSVC